MQARWVKSDTNEHQLQPGWVKQGGDVVVEGCPTFPWLVEWGEVIFHSFVTVTVCTTIDLSIVVPEFAIQDSG